MKYGGIIIEKSLETGYRLIIRPHPRPFTSDKEQMDALMKEYPESERLRWDRSVDNFAALRESDILIFRESSLITQWYLTNR